MPPRSRNADATRQRLVAAALELFGRKGFEATSTREIADAAKTNIGSIAYHFGGKAGLQEACGEAIVARLKTVIGDVPRDDAALSPDAALARFEAVLSAMVRFLVIGEGARPFVAFILREMSEPSRALDRIYTELFEPLHRHACRLWGAATGADPDSEETRIAVFALIGQALYFRIGRTVVVRRLDWQDIGEAQGRMILDRILGNLRALVATARERHR